MKRKAKRGIPEGIVGTTLFLLIFLLAHYVLQNSEDFRKAGSYSYYQGPILPMTSVSGAEGITVQRQVELDFSVFSQAQESILDPLCVAVEDAYVLQNPTPEPKRVVLAYPFEGQMTDEARFIPAIRVNGTPVEAEFAAAPDVQNVVKNAGTWKGYKKAILEHDHLGEALAEPPALDIPVTVLHFYDIGYEGERDLGNIFLSMEFQKPEEVSLWVHEMRCISYDAISREMGLMFQATTDFQGEGWLIAKGDLPALAPKGNKGYEFGRAPEETTVTWQLETYDTTLGAVLQDLAQEYDFWEDNSSFPDPGLATPEEIYSGAAKRYASGLYKDTMNGCIDVSSLFYETVSEIVLMYWIFPVEVPANGTVAVSAKYQQECSEDFAMENDRGGCDIAATLGSNLDIRTQSVSVTNLEGLQVSGQNMDLDPAKGIWQAALDGEEERYFIDVVPKKEA